MSICLTKVSILLLYLRSLTYEWTKISLWILMAVVVVTGLAYIGVVATACLPLHALWDDAAHAAYCHPREVYYAIAGLQIGTDFLIFLLPLPVVWSMRSPRDQKAVLITVFSFGFLYVTKPPTHPRGKLPCMSPDPDGPPLILASASSRWSGSSSSPPTTGTRTTRSRA